MKKIALLCACLLWLGPAPGAMAADKTFKLITSPWIPFIGKELKNDGWTMEVARAALEPQGYSVSIELVPWKRAMAESEKGEADGLYLSYYAKEREQFYVFSDPIGQLRTGLFKLKKTPLSYTSIQDLKKYTIGLTRGAAVSPEFDAAGYLKKEETNDDLISLHKLLKGRIDLLAGPELVVRHMILTQFSAEDQDKFEFMEPPLAIHNLHLAISKNASDYKRKLADFNRGLKKIQADGTYRSILQRHGF